MAANTLIIDGNSIGYASHYATKLTAGELETQAIFGFIRTMRELKLIYPNYTPIVLWDGKAQWRYELCPSYKSNRKDDPKKLRIREAYVAQRPYIARALNALGIRQLTVKTHEADDMAGHLVTQLSKNPDNKIQLITGDGDWLQLVRSNVSWRDMRDDAKQVDAKNFYDKTGFKTPYLFLQGKCLQGDSSDVIPGVARIGEKTAPLFLAEFGSVSEFWKAVDNGTFKPKKAIHTNLASPKCRAEYARNLKMMQLLKVTPPNAGDVVTDIGRFDQNKFTELCEELAFNSIIKTMDMFVIPFKPTKE